jgi:hypothetical protein
MKGHFLRRPTNFELGRQLLAFEEYLCFMESDDNYANGVSLWAVTEMVLLSFLSLTYFTVPTYNKCSEHLGWPILWLNIGQIGYKTDYYCRIEINNSLGQVLGRSGNITCLEINPHGQYSCAFSFAREPVCWGLFLNWLREVFWSERLRKRAI